MTTILLILGLLLMVGGGYLIVRSLLLYWKDLVTKGQVIDFRIGQESKKGKDGLPVTIQIYYPIFKYEFGDQEYVKESKVGVKDQYKYEKGGDIDIVIDEKHPENAKVTDMINLYFIPALISLVGMVFVILSLVV
jgi:hypothetical protein